MRPILLKGHERPLTFIKYNSEGDLLFTCAKDHNPTLWYGDTGERVGTYVGHNGAVDVMTNDSTTFVTGSADTTCKVGYENWGVLFTFKTIGSRRWRFWVRSWRSLLIRSWVCRARYTS